MSLYPHYDRSAARSPGCAIPLGFGPTGTVGSSTTLNAEAEVRVGCGGGEAVSVVRIDGPEV